MTCSKQSLRELKKAVEAGESFVDAQIVSVFGKFGPPEQGNAWLCRKAYELCAAGHRIQILQRGF